MHVVSPSGCPVGFRDPRRIFLGKQPAQCLRLVVGAQSLSNAPGRAVLALPNKVPIGEGMVSGLPHSHGSWLNMGPGEKDIRASTRPPTLPEFNSGVTPSPVRVAFPSGHPGTPAGHLYYSGKMSGRNIEFKSSAKWLHTWGIGFQTRSFLKQRKL